jgi:putative phosphoribosyl transferase
MMEFIADTEHPVLIPCNGFHLEGILHIPHEVRGIVLFAHGSGSGRLSPRNQYIARTLQQAKFATLLFDLLTQEEDEIDEKTMEFRFDIELLATRLVSATEWMNENPTLHTLPKGYFGASTGGGAALVAAAAKPDLIKAVVSRGGRPDLAGDALSKVKAATLFIVGELDETVIELNQEAYRQLDCEKNLITVAGATHLFEEPGKLAEVSLLANEWFKKYLSS